MWLSSLVVRGSSGTCLSCPMWPARICMHFLIMYSKKANQVIDSWILQKSGCNWELSDYWSHTVATTSCGRALFIKEFIPRLELQAFNDLALMPYMYAVQIYTFYATQLNQGRNKWAASIPQLQATECTFDCIHNFLCGLTHAYYIVYVILSPTNLPRQLRWLGYFTRTCTNLGIGKAQLWLYIHMYTYHTHACV